MSLELSMGKLEGPLGGGHVIRTQLILTDRPLQQQVHMRGYRGDLGCQQYCGRKQLRFWQVAGVPCIRSVPPA